jgi:hypothetical protein
LATRLSQPGTYVWKRTGSVRRKNPA